MTIMEHINLYLEDGLLEKEAIKKVAVERGVPKSVIYKEYHIDNK
jgi:16S rRNA (cytidine1402-2'-O)-methyltransferase